MGWNFEKPYIVDLRNVIRMFDLNDAALCVEKMGENGDWISFTQKSFPQTNLKLDYVGNIQELIYALDKLNAEYTAWLFNADNFFSAMAEWLKIKKEGR
jgi:hypothetical protein